LLPRNIAQRLIRTCRYIKSNSTTKSAALEERRYIYTFKEATKGQPRAPAAGRGGTFKPSHLYEFGCWYASSVVDGAGSVLR